MPRPDEKTVRALYATIAELPKPDYYTEVVHALMGALVADRVDDTIELRARLREAHGALKRWMSCEGAVVCKELRNGQQPTNNKGST